MESIQTKITIIFSSIILITCSAISIVAYNKSTNIIQNSISSQAKAIIENAVKVIDVNEFKKIETEKEESGYYNTLRTQLNEYFGY